MTDEEQRRIFGVNLSYQISISGKMQKEIALDLDVNQTTMSTSRAIFKTYTAYRIPLFYLVFKNNKTL